MKSILKSPSTSPTKPTTTKEITTTSEPYQPEPRSSAIHSVRHRCRSIVVSLKISRIFLATIDIKAKSPQTKRANSVRRELQISKYKSWAAKEDRVRRHRHRISGEAPKEKKVTFSLRLKEHDKTKSTGKTL